MIFAQQDLDLYKSQYPNDPQIQALTLNDVNAHAAGTVVDFNTVPPLEHYDVRKRSLITPCSISVGFVIFDTICLAIGAVGLRSTIKGPAIEAIVEAASPALNKIEQIVAKMAAPNANRWDQAAGFFDILLAIYNAGCLGDVVNAFLDSLTWWDAVLYGIVAIGTIIAILATDGIALAAEIVVLLASAALLLSDIYKAVDACFLQPSPVPEPAKAPLSFSAGVFGGLRTHSGNFVTAVSGGGVFATGNPINTNRRAVEIWEKFIVIPVGKAGDFALKTAAGGFVSATNGGGITGPDGPTCPIRTVWPKVDAWERLQLTPQNDGTYGVGTQTGFFLTAEYGGGQPSGTPTQALTTDATSVGPFETFRFVP